MFDRGTLVVGGIIAIGVGLASFALWFQRQQTYEALDFWGHEGAIAIRAGEHVELSRLAPVASANAEQETVDYDGLTLAIVEHQDVTKAHGAVHMRQALLENVSFDFSSPALSPAFNPEYAFTFYNLKDEVAVTALIDFKSQRIRFVEGRREAGLTSRLAEGLPVFIDEQFAPGPMR